MQRRQRQLGSSSWPRTERREASEAKYESSERNNHEGWKIRHASAASKYFTFRYPFIFEAMHLANTAEVFGSSGQSYAVCTMHFKWKVITMAHHPSHTSLRYAYLMHAPFGKCKLARSHLDSCVSLCSTFSGPFLAKG